MTLGERIKELREQRGLSQDSLAGKVNVSKQVLQKWEEDINEPNLKTARKLAHELGVEIGYLVSNDVQIKNDDKSFLADTANKRIVAVVMLVSSIVLLLGQLTFAYLHPIQRNQRISAFWWYVPSTSLENIVFLSCFC